MAQNIYKTSHNPLTNTKTYVTMASHAERGHLSQELKPPNQNGQNINNQIEKRNKDHRVKRAFKKEKFFCPIYIN